MQVVNSRRAVWALSAFGLLFLVAFLYFRPCEVSGEVFSTEQSHVIRASGVTVYALPSTSLSFRNLAEEVEALRGTEAEAIFLDATSGKASCGQYLVALAKQDFGLSGPADAEFYKVKQLWSGLAATQQVRSMTAMERVEFANYYWKQQVLSNPSLKSLSERDKQAYNAELLNVGNSPDEMASKKLAASPQTRVDSTGQFSMRLAKGKYLFLAADSIPESGVWATVQTVDGPTRVILGDDNRVCFTLR